MITACDDCIYIADLGLVPRHVVHPQRGTPQLYDTSGLALCLECGGVWHRPRGAHVPELIGCVPIR
jgi:hypothetical protein